VKNSSIFLAANGAEAETLLNDAQVMDDALDSARLSPGTDILKARILAAATQTPQNNQTVPQTPQRQGMGYRAVAAMTLFAFTLGFAGANMLGGANTNPAEDDQVLIAETSEWQELADDYGLDDIYEWVEGTDTTG